MRRERKGGGDFEKASPHLYPLHVSWLRFHSLNIPDR